MERELCLQIPPENLDSVAHALKAQNAQPIALRALYFDTASRALARAGIALRVRREGPQWVQTLKAPGTDALSRIELNHPRDSDTLELSLYRASPLQHFFAQLNEPLKLRFETDVQRHVLLVAHQGTQIEIAFDHGAIVANGWTLPVRELEFELVSGSMDALFDLAELWLLRYGLVLEIRSKAHRGDILADLDPAPVQNSSPPTHAFKARPSRPVKLTPDLSPKEAYLLCSNECLEQTMSNAALLAIATTGALDAATQASYIRQLRLGIRRLRSCRKLFKETVPALGPENEKILERYSGVLRDAAKTPATFRVDTADHFAFQAALLAYLQHLIKLGDDQRL